LLEHDATSPRAQGGTGGAGAGAGALDVLGATEAAGGGGDGSGAALAVRAAVVVEPPHPESSAPPARQDAITLHPDVMRSAVSFGVAARASQKRWRSMMAGRSRPHQKGGEVVLEQINEVLDVIEKITQLIGIPVAIIVYGLTKRRERLDREYATYDALDAQYIEYLELCLEHPELDVADVPVENDGPEARKELLVFSILLSMMERAFLMYGEKSARIRREQWEKGWAAYIDDWCTRPKFMAAATKLVRQYDERFSKYLLDCLKAKAGPSRAA
jgi:hypothetical protein